VLTRLRVPLLALVVCLLVIPTAATAAPNGGANCDHSLDPSCSAWADQDGDNNGTSGSGRSGCTWQGQTVPCHDPDYGSYVGDGCYWKPMDPPLAARPPSGEDPATGAWGVQACLTAPGSSTFTLLNLFGGGASGVLSPTSRAQTSVEIGEVQVVAQ
jgi:hypothetical protein